MKKIKISAAIVFLLLTLVTVLAGCAPERFSFGTPEAARIELSSGKGPYQTRVILTDPDDIQAVTNSIHALSFRKKGPGEVFGNTAYLIRWFDAQNKEVQGMLFFDLYHIDYNGYIYETQVPVDSQLLDGFLKNGSHEFIKDGSHIVY